jgi:hypothetical protein
MTKINVTRYADCPFSAALELAEKSVGARKDLYVTPAPPLGEHVHFAAGSTEDRSDESRKHDALLVAWRPETRKMFPDFRGVLTVRPERHGVWIRLSGEYAPPLGAAGTVFDLVFGRAIARRTMHRFLDDVVAGIEAAYREERQHTKSA